ncbi:outer membrane usher protein [Cupriavidus sp. YR651]|nr:outer membrane usher protein [Cupriavidus sp. YR651]
MCFGAAAGADDDNAASPELLADVQFDDQLLQQANGHRVDIRRFSRRNAVLPGDYRVDLVVNQTGMGRADVAVRRIGDEEANVQPCFGRALLARIGVDTSRLSAEAEARLRQAPDACAPLPDLIAGGAADFDSNEQRLALSIPQVAMVRHARGYVDPKYWDDGVTAARLQYNANHYSTIVDGRASSHGYVGLDAGFNIGPWRFRHGGSLNQDDRLETRYQSVQTLAQRAIAPIRSQLTLGDAFTDGALFDSVGLRGAQLATDDRMFPESQRGYAPTIRGIANSNARVVIRQNGNVIYETTVAAGAFEINDLYPTGYGGDLEVVVQEADGSVRVSRTPYAAAVNALRPGVTRYGVALGQYRNATIRANPLMLQATIQHGLSNLVTAYGGMLVARDYAAALLGAAFNTTYGAVGVDVTQALARLQHQPAQRGHSVRLSYSKLVAPTRTNLTLAAYRYSSRRYLGLSDAIALGETSGGSLSPISQGIQRARLQLTVNQPLALGFGSFYLTGSMQNYWNANGSDLQFQLGYSNHYRRLGYGVSASRQYNVNNVTWDNRVMLTLSIPLGEGPGSPYSTTSIEHASDGTVNAQQSVAGTVGDDNRFTYGLNAGYSNGGQANHIASLGANASYAAPAATLTGNVSASNAYTQVGLGISGGIVAYERGVVLAPSMGDTLAIVEAEHAAGARVANGNGLRLDRSGRAVVSNMTPFSMNSVEVDPTGLPLDVELASTEQRVAPSSGAVVTVPFATLSKGRTAVIRARTADGRALPFGAEVLGEAGHPLGTVGQAGRVIVHGLPAGSGRLRVRLGGKPGDVCDLHYALPDAANAPELQFIVTEAICS